jgi:hypothetical protein
MAKMHLYTVNTYTAFPVKYLVTKKCIKAICSTFVLSFSCGSELLVLTKQFLYVQKVQIMLSLSKAKPEPKLGLTIL